MWGSVNTCTCTSVHTYCNPRYYVVPISTQVHVELKELYSMHIMERTMDVAKFSRYMERAVSTAPPPGTTRLDSSTLFTTQSESCSDRSISSTIKSLAPRRMMEAALRAPGLRREWRRRRGGVTERKKPGGRREEGGWCERREGEAGEEYRSEELAIPVSYIVAMYAGEYLVKFQQPSQWQGGFGKFG